MKVTAIVQARMGSTRLSGKVLQPIGGRSMLERVCRRARRARLLDELVVATSDLPCDDAVATECERLGVPCFRGSEDDVLDRYHRAAQSRGAEAVVRITADCPLVDPEVLDEVVAAFLRERPDYASNVLRRTYPRGLDVEVFTAAALDRAWREATEPYDREHTTPYFYRNPQLFALLSVTGPEDCSSYRWTVDWAEDLALVRAVYERLGRAGSPGTAGGCDDAFSWRDVLRLFESDPALAKIAKRPTGSLP